VQRLLAPFVLTFTALALVGCTDDASQRPAATKSTTSILVLGTDGARISSGDLAVVVGAVDLAAARGDGAGAAAGELMSFQLRAAGLSEAEVACVVAGSGSGGTAGLDPTVLLGCVPADRVAALSSGAPVDLAALPVEEIRPVLVTVVDATIATLPFDQIERMCVVDTAVGALSDDAVASLVSGLGPTSVPTLSQAVSTCLSGPRVTAIADVIRSTPQVPPTNR